MPFGHVLNFRVRYSETDQLGTFYNSRALEWFECGRTELLRAAGIAYADMENRGTYLPLIEAHVKYQGRARYDDALEMTSMLSFSGNASLRFDVVILHAQSKAPVAEGYTIHAMTDGSGKPIRCPPWIAEAVERVSKS